MDVGGKPIVDFQKTLKETIIEMYEERIKNDAELMKIFYENREELNADSEKKFTY